MKKKSNVVLKDEMQDDLRPEYDFKKLTIVARGPGRNAPATTIQLAPDVAEVFPDERAVNEGLRLLIRLVENKGKKRRR